MLSIILNRGSCEMSRNIGQAQVFSFFFFLFRRSAAIVTTRKKVRANPQ